MVNDAKKSKDIFGHQTKFGFRKFLRFQDTGQK